MCIRDSGSAVYNLFSLSNGKLLKKTEKPIEELFIVGVLPILAGSKQYLVLSDQTLFLVDVLKSLSSSTEVIKIENKIAGNHGTIADIKFVGPGLNKLALATNSPTLRIIPTPVVNENDERTFPIEVEMYEGHTDLLNSLDATSDGLWVATASKDHSVILWRYHNSQERFFPFAKFVGHVGSVNAVGLPNIMTRSWPEFIISASNDLTIKKWKVPKVTGDEPSDVIVVKTSEYTRRAHEKDINAISISPNDSILSLIHI